MPCRIGSRRGCIFPSTEGPPTEQGACGLAPQRVGRPDRRRGRLVCVRLRLGVSDELFQPRIGFGQHVQDRLAGPVAVAFLRQHHQPCSAAEALHRREHALALDREGAGIVVFLAVHQQQCVLDPVGVVERRHRPVGLRRGPVVAFLGLEAERRERAVVSAAAGDADLEHPRVRQQVGDHERAIGVTADGDAVAVGHAATHDLVDRGFGAGDQLRQVGVVRFLVALADDRHRGIVQHRIAAREKRMRPPVTDRVEAIRRIGDLRCGGGGFELGRICPHQQRQRFVAARQETRRQIQVGCEFDAILALVADLPLLHVLQLRRGVFERRQRDRRGLAGKIEAMDIRRFARRLARDQDLRGLIVQYCDDRRIGRRFGTEQALPAQILDVPTIEERTIAFGRRSVADQIDVLAVAAEHQPRKPVRVAYGHRLARVVVAVFARTFEDEFRRGLRRIGCDLPTAGVARLPPNLAKQRDIAPAPLDPGVTVAQCRQHYRRPVEGCRLHEHMIAELDVPRRVAAVLGLGPDQRRRGIAAPTDRTHAEGRRIAAAGQAF